MNHNFQSFDSCILLIYRLKNMPRCIGRTRLCDHLIDRILVFIPLFTVAPVFICDLPLFLRCILPVRKAGKLGIFVNLYPEFDNDSAPVMKFLLKLVDFIIGTPQSFSLQNPSRRSTMTLPYHVRSKIAICPVFGSLVQKRHK